MNYLGFPEGGSLLVDVIDPLTGLLKAQINAGAGGVGNLIIAGDGYAYLPYVSYNENTCPGIGKTSLALLRMDTSGGSSSIPLGAWDTLCTANGQSGTVAYPTSVNVITNADQGTLVSWQLETAPYSTAGFGTPSVANYIAVTSGGSLITQGKTSQLVQPVLQAQDGTFYGTNVNTGGMVKVDQSGNVQWSVPNDSPQIATADDGVVGSSGITYDSNGRADGQVGSPIQSWTGSEAGIAYQYGSVDQVPFSPIIYTVPAFSSFAGANQSGNGTSAICHDDRDKLIVEYPKYGAGFLPVCFASEFVPSSNSNPDPDFSFSVLNQDDMYYNDYPDWAIFRSSMLVGLEQWFHNYGQPVTLFVVKSGYRSPYAQNQINSSAPQDRHIHGDAVDVASSANTWAALKAAAKATGACVEPIRLQNNSYNHVHAQWHLPCPKSDW